MRVPTSLMFLLLSLLLSTDAVFSQDNTLTQVSTINALMDGAYDGSISVAELKKSGDFGLGTFDALDGEMVITLGSCYKIKSDGSIEIPEDTEKIPFASMAVFHPEVHHIISDETDLKGIEKTIDELMPGKNILCAVKITGRFKVLTARSVPKQKRPYTPLLEVVKNQSEFKFENVEGTIIGFKCPGFLKGLNVPGYHFHFISDDRKSGGHVLNFVVTGAGLQIERLSAFRMLMPQDDTFLNMNLESNKEQEINKVEK